MQISNNPAVKGQTDLVIKGEVKARMKKATELVIKAEKNPKEEKEKTGCPDPVIKGEIKVDPNEKKKEETQGTLDKFMEKHPSRFEAAKGGKGKMTHKPY